MNTAYSNEELTKLYERTQNSVYAVAYSIVKNEQDACDLTQDTYIAAFTSLEKLNDIEKFDKWVIQIAANKCKDFLRKKKPALFSQISGEDNDFEDDIRDDAETSKPDSVYENKEQKEIIKNILYSLPEDQRLCLILFYGQDLKIAEIAEALDISENTVKSRLSYGKKKMKEQIEALEKKGTKIRGFAGLGLLPLFKDLFASGSGSFPASSALSATKVLANVAKGASTVKRATFIPQVVSKVTGVVTKNLATKVVSAVVAISVATTATVAVVNPSLFSKKKAEPDKAPCTSVFFAKDVIAEVESAQKEVASSRIPNVASKESSSEQASSVVESEPSVASSSEVTTSSEPVSSKESIMQETISSTVTPEKTSSKTDIHLHRREVVQSERTHRTDVICEIGKCPTEQGNEEPHQMVNFRCQVCGYKNNDARPEVRRENCDICGYDCAYESYYNYVNETQHEHITIEHVKNIEWSTDGQIQNFNGNKTVVLENHTFDENGFCSGCSR